LARFNIILPDDLAKQLRLRVVELHGGEKGALSKAIAEAVELWLRQKEPSSKKK